MGFSAPPNRPAPPSRLPRPPACWPGCAPPRPSSPALPCLQASTRASTSTHARAPLAASCGYLLLAPPRHQPCDQLSRHTNSLINGAKHTHMQLNQYSQATHANSFPRPAGQQLLHPAASARARTSTSGCTSAPRSPVPPPAATRLRPAVPTGDGEGGGRGEGGPAAAQLGFPPGRHAGATREGWGKKVLFW